MKFVFRLWLALMFITFLNIFVVVPLLGGKAGAVLLVVFGMIYGILEGCYFLRK